MRKLIPFAFAFALLVAIAACSPAAVFELQGNYDLTVEVTESTHPNFPVGYTEPGTAQVTVAEDEVTMDLGNYAVTGTRSGNAVELTGTTSEGEAQFDLLWTSDDSFTGTGRIDYTGGEYVVFDITGTESISITGFTQQAGLFQR